MNATSKRIAILATLCAIGIWYFGSYHFVHGSREDSYKIKKISWSLSETFINLDEVKGMPLLIALARYPLFMQSHEAAKE